MTEAATLQIRPAAAHVAERRGLRARVRVLCFGAATMLLATLGGILVSLVLGGWPAFQKFGVSFFVTSTWDPVQGSLRRRAP